RFDSNLEITAIGYGQLTAVSIPEHEEQLRRAVRLETVFDRGPKRVAFRGNSKVSGVDGDLARPSRRGPLYLEMNFAPELDLRRFDGHFSRGSSGAGARRARHQQHGSACDGANLVYWNPHASVNPSRMPETAWISQLSLDAISATDGVGTYALVI